MIKFTTRDLLNTIQGYFYVEDKDSNVVVFAFNVIQRAFGKLLIQLKDDPNNKKPVRLLILKGRQFGFSTLITAYFFIKCVLIPNTRAAVVSHEQEATKKLFRRVRFFANTLCVKPQLDKDSEKEYSFPLTNSYFYIGTAGAKAFGRGDNLTDVHCSEVAFWPNAATLMNGLIQSVGKTGTIIIETTANGVGDYLHKLWVKSYQVLGSTWLGVFYSWVDFPEYEMEPGPGFTLTDYEKHLISMYPNLTKRKLAWRRFKIGEIEDDKGRTPEEIFMQEYPIIPREAFLASGNCVFDKQALEAYQPKKPIKIENGWLIYKLPSGYSVAGIDIAEGLINHDRSIIDIYDENLEQVAHWAGWCDTDQLAEIARPMLIRYNSYVVPEINNMGIAFLNVFKKKYSISKIYHREVIDTFTKVKSVRPGWRTTGLSKGRLVANLQTAIRTHEIKFNNPDTINECYSFIKVGNNISVKYQADEGCNDDRVITAGLAIQGYMDKPPSKKNITPEQKEKADVDKINKKWHNEKKIQRIKRLKRRQTSKP